MKKFAVVLLLALPLHAASPSASKLKITQSQKNLYILEGTVGSTPATMFLTLPQAKGNIEVFYYYNKYKTAIPLSGVFTNNSSLQFAELGDDNKTDGVFKGSFEPSKGFSGVWEGGGKSLPVELKPSSGLAKQITFYCAQTKADKQEEDEEGAFKTSEISLDYALPLIYNPQKKPILSRINQVIGSEKDPFGSLTLLIENSYKEWDNDTDSFNTDLSESWEFLSLDERFLGFHRGTYKYYGGAHGSYTLEFYVFSMETGERISEAAEIFSNPSEPKLTALLQKKLLEWGDGDRNVFFDFDKIRLINNFMIEAKGMRFVYNQYDIAAYVYGQPEVFFTFDELKPFLKKGGALDYLLK